MPKFEPKHENKWQKNKQKKHPYVFKVLHNTLKPEDRIKMMKIVEANRKEADDNAV